MNWKTHLFSYKIGMVYCLCHILCKEKRSSKTIKKTITIYSLPANKNSLIFSIFLCQLVVSIHVGIAHCFETSLFYLKKDIDLRGQGNSGFDIF
jgi:hypothetical protein